MKTKIEQTENIRRHIGESVTIRWGTSRGRDSYGYTTCSLRNSRGERIAACNGGGYDMRGTVLGNWLAWTFPNELRALKESDMPENSHWQADDHRECRGECLQKARDAFHRSLANDDPEAALINLPKLSRNTWECPVCKGPTRQARTGKRVEDPRGFGGLTFHDPNYDAGAAIIGRDCSDRTLGKEGESEGKTVAEREAAGVSFGLERLQATYKRSSKWATERHTEPSIDGACGESSVMQIAGALGIGLRKVASTSKLDVYVITDASQEA